MKFGKILICKREDHNLTQAEVAERNGVSRQFMLGRVDTTAQRPSYSHIFRVSTLIFLDIRQYACEKSP